MNKNYIIDATSMYKDLQFKKRIIKTGAAVAAGKAGNQNQIYFNI